MLLFAFAGIALCGCDPKGFLDWAAVSVDGNGITVSGWALDEETPKPIQVTVAIANGERTRIAAKVPRGDIAALYPKLGADHGYSATLPAAVGKNTVCVAAHNFGKGNDILQGCREVVVPAREPLGSLEVAVARDNSIFLSGWAGDPDALSNSTVALLDLTAPAIGQPLRAEVVASTPRPDKVALTGIGQVGGYEISVPVTEPGTRRLCTVVLNQRGGSDRFLGCAFVEVADTRPSGAVDSVTISVNTVTVSGTATDPDGGAVNVRFGPWTNEGGFGAVSTTTTAGRWSATFTRPDGAHRFCPTLTDNGPKVGITGDRSLPCAWASIGELNVATTGATSATRPVSSANPSFATADRDAGVSTQLSDGSTLWLFGDTITYNPNGSINHFVNGTAAWAPAGAETAPRDAVDANGRPFRMVAPGPNFGSCPAERPNKALWVLSATTIERATDDRVVVYLANMCLGDAWNMESKGVSVAEYIYDPTNPPDGRPIELTLLNENLFPTPERAWGTAAVSDATHIYAYQCDSSPSTVTYGPCRVARVPHAEAHLVSSYRYWAGGSTWAASASSAVTLTMPTGYSPVSNYDFPVASMTVSFDRVFGYYVMTYSPWPGLSSAGALRVSSSPTGPWTAPVGMEFPDCETWNGSTQMYCYAVTPQPWLSTSGRLGVGIFDQSTHHNSLNGQYVVASLPVAIHRRDG